MNSLSWLIYFASLSDGAASFFGGLAAMGAIFTCAGAVLSVVWTDGGYSSFDGNRDRRIQGYEETRKRGRWLAARGFVLLVACGFVSVVLPPKNTVYAIAASEVAGQVVQSEAVKGMTDESLKALQAWIKKQIEPAKEK